MLSTATLIRRIPVNERIPCAPQVRYGRLTVLELDYKRNKKSYWRCLCDCGENRVVCGHELRNGDTQSCGCLRSEKSSQRRFIHGESRRPYDTPEFRTYCWAKDRCVNPRHPKYADYGGRGIEFRFESYEEFLAEVGRRPANKRSLDRIDNDGHYEPGNVRWADYYEQQAHTRKSHFVTVGGETHHLSEWTRRRGFGKGTIAQRLKMGWCDECAVMQPLGVRCDHKGGK